MLRITYSIIVLALICVVHLSGNSQSVDPLTGRAIVNLPLGEISALDLSASVSLSHHGGALQVTEGPGNAGMGWNVNAGGRIVREVRGLPDHLNFGGKTGWLVNNNAQNIQNLAGSTDATFLNGLGYVKDPEPDIYYFNAPGISGKFIFGADGQIKMIPYQDLSISFLGDFIIKTNTGMVYTFSNAMAEITTRQAFKFKESVSVNHWTTNYNYYQAPVQFTSAWNLVSIASNATGATVNFSYQTAEEANASEFVTRVQPNGTADTLYYIKDTVTPNQLSQISLKNYSIAFTWIGSKIYGITLSESETGQKKEYSFAYRSIYGYGATSFLDPAKDFLMRVSETSTSACTGLPAYVFTYAGVDTTDYPMNITGKADVDWRTNWAQDFFGYYNGKRTNKSIPTIYYYSAETGGRRLRVTPIPGATASQILYGTTIGQQNMSVDATYNSFGALTSIYYPTGAVTDISYEANKYYDPTTGEELFGPGVRVSSITTTGNESAYGGNPKANKFQYHGISKSYQYTNAAGTTTSGSILYPPAFAFSDGTNIFRTQTNMSPASQVLYSRVRENMIGQGYRIYEYDVPNVFTDVEPAAPSAKFTAGTGPVGTWINSQYSFPFAPLQDFDFKRGFLTKVSDFTQAGALTQEKSYTYIMPQAVTTVQGLRYESVKDVANNDVFSYSIYVIPINQSRILSQEVVKVVSEEAAANFTTATTAYQYNAKNIVTQVTQTNADNSVGVQTFKYALDYAITSPITTDLQANAIFKLNADNRYAEVIEATRTFTPRGGTAVVAASKLNLWKVTGNYVWPYQTKSFPQLATITPSAVIAGATQGFSSDANYVLESTMDYVNGLPANVTGIDLIPRCTHYASGTTLPIASFVNCKAENVVYDGFEAAKDRGIESAVASTTLGRTGKKAAQLSSSTALTTGTTNLIVKRDTKYRISCWAFSTQTGGITVQARNGTTVQSSVVLNYTTANQWQYIENFLDVSAVAASFNLAISTTNAAGFALDDFLAIPQSARATFSTITPLIGPTSQTDDRGNSIVSNYDLMGRKTTTLDRQRNLVELQEYGLQRQVGLPALTAGIGVNLIAAFGSNTTKYVQGQQVQFTAADNCLPQVSYAWTFDEKGVQSFASGKIVYKTFNTFGQVKVQLVVSAPGYNSVTYKTNLCVGPSPSLSASISVSPINKTYNCNSPISGDDNVRSFTVMINGWTGAGWTVNYSWFITDQNGNYFTADSFYPAATSNGYQLTYSSPPYSYQVKCIVTATRSDYPVSDCVQQVNVGTVTQGIQYIFNSQCQ